MPKMVEVTKSKELLMFLNLFHFCFRLPLLLSSTVNDNEIRICELTVHFFILFHVAGLPVDGQLESNRAAPQTPNPAPHGTCVSICANN